MLLLLSGTGEYQNYDSYKIRQHLDKLLGNCQKVEKTDRELAEERKRIIENIERFLTLESVTNIDLRQIIDQITVNKNGEVKIYIKNLKNAPNETRFGV